MKPLYYGRYLGSSDVNRNLYFFNGGLERAGTKIYSLFTNQVQYEIIPKSIWIDKESMPDLAFTTCVNIGHFLWFVGFADISDINSNRLSTVVAIDIILLVIQFGSHQ